MAVALLVLGALMSGAGIYAVVFGYSIIQVEEGWASVISGATLFAGGVVTMALGLVLRVLKQVQTGLLDAPLRVPSDVTAAPPLAADAELKDPPPLPALEPAAADIATMHASEEPAFTAKAEEPVLHAPANPSPARDFPVSVPAADHWSNVPKPADTSPDAMPAFDPYPSAQLHEAPAASARPADDYKLETPSTAEHDLPAVEPSQTTRPAEEPPSPAMDDWLDRAFAELDRDNPPWPPRKAEPEVRTSAETADQNLASSSSPETRSPPLEPAVAEHAQSAPARAEAVAAPKSPAPDPPTPKPQGAPSPSAVIGRYESDGTTYVMFADGSIEAQSASGVYRFASMAELKSYIEK